MRKIPAAFARRPRPILGAAFEGLKQYAEARHHPRPKKIGLPGGRSGGSLPSSLNRSGRTRPRNVEEALAQSRKHARLALSEILHSVSYLIDAAALALGAGQNPLLDSGWTSLVSAIEETARKLADVQPHTEPGDRVAEILAAGRALLCAGRLRCEVAPVADDGLPGPPSRGDAGCLTLQGPAGDRP